MILKIFKIIFLSSFFISFTQQQQCFDYGIDPTVCRVCNYKYYFNSSFDWSFTTFPIENCAHKHDSFERVVYVDSSLNCSQGNYCDGTFSYPFNDLFIALENVMAHNLPYLNSSLHLYLYGKNSHTLYTNKTSNQGFLMFRRMNIKIIIETLLCSFMNILGCYTDEYQQAEILIKRNDIMFFISNQMIIKNLKFNGIDVILYNKTNDLTFKDANKGFSFCSEVDLETKNSEIEKSLCFLDKNVFFFPNTTYGLFNLEILYDDQTFPTPEIQIQNCEFIYLNFINESSSFIKSLINALQGFPISISIINTNFNKFFLYKGILNLNQFSDPFYVFVSISHILKSTPQGSMNLSLMNISITEYNNLILLVLNSDNQLDFLSIFNLHINATMNQYSNIPTLNILLQNSTISFLINSNYYLLGIQFYFIRFSGFNNFSNFSVFDCNFVNNSYIFFVHIWNFANIIIDSSIFKHNHDFTFFFYSNPIMFSKNTLNNISANSYSLMYIENNNLNIFDCSFINFYFDLSLFLFHSSEFEVISYSDFINFNLPFSSTEIIIKNNLFRNITSGSVILLNVIWNFIGFNNIFESINGKFLIYFQAVKNLFYLAYSDFYSFEIDNFIQLLFINGLSHYSNLNIITNTTLWIIKVIYRNGTTIFDNIFLDINFIWNFYFCDSAGSLSFVNYQVTNSLFKGFDSAFPGNIGIVNDIFLFGEVNLVLIENVTIEYECAIYSKYVKGINIGNFKNDYINSFINITNMVLVRVQLLLLMFTNVYISNCSFISPESSNAILSVQMMMSKYSYFALMNSNFSHLRNPVFEIYTFKITNMLISNCLFLNTSGIFLSFSLPDNFILNNLVNRNDDVFFTNYYQYCNSQLHQDFSDFDNPSFEYCLNYSIKNKTIFSIYDKIGFNMSEWSFIFLNNYGIINSAFIGGDFGSTAKCFDFICLDLSLPTNILLKNCLFKDRDLHKANLMTLTNYIAVIINCSFQNFFSWSSGGILFELYNSQLFISNCSFENILSLSNGAIFYLQECIYIIINSCNFQNVNSSVQGSIIYFLNSNVNVSNSRINYSYVTLKGGHIYGEEGNLTILNSDFISGYSNYGGSIYVTQLDYLLISNSSFKNNTSQKGGLFLQGTNIEIIYQFYNVSFADNSGIYGSCIYSKDANLYMKNSIFTSNIANNSFIFFYSSFFPFHLSILNISMQDNNGILKGIYTEKSNFTLILTNFSNNIFSNNFIDIVSCYNIYLLNCTFAYDKNFKGQAKHQILISAQSSQGLFQNINLYAAYYSNCLSLILSNFNIIGSKFQSCNLALNIVQQSYLNLTFSNLIDNIGNNGAGILLSDSSLLCLNTLFVNNSANQGSDIYFKNSGSKLMIYTLKDLVFNNFDQNSIYFSGNLSITLENMIFSQEENGNIANQAISGTNFKNILLKNCSFTNLKHMSALYFLNTQTTQMIDIVINSSNFINCSTDSSGGALSLFGNMTLNIFESVFLDNTAEEDGGAIYYDCTMCYLAKFFLQINLKNNKFFNNSCQNSGGAIKALDLNETSISTENEFKYNFDKVGADLSTKAHKLFISNDSSLYNETILIFNYSNSITNFTAASGQYLALNISLLDKFNNFLKDENTGMIQITNANANDSSLKLLYSSQPIINGIAVFNISIVGKINTIYEVNITYTYGNIEIIQKMYIWLRWCIQGEYQIDVCLESSNCNLNNTQYINSQCLTCGLGFYSLIPTEECTICVDHANCPGGNAILPIDGYWRFNEYSSKILKCGNIYSCPDQQLYQSNSINYTYICRIGSFGNLCSNCDEGYGVSSDKACLICQASAKVIILGVFNFLVLVYQSAVVFNVGKQQSVSRSLLKLIINHTNYITLLSVFSHSMFSDKLNLILNLKDQVSTIGTITDGTIADCFIQKFFDKENVVIARISLFSFFPIIIFIVLCIVRIALIFLTYIIKKKRVEINMKLLIISCFILVIYSFYPKLVYNAFSLLKCIPLDDTNRVFLEIDPNIQCWQQEHIKYIMSIFFPNLLFYCIGWPLFLFFMLYRKKTISLKKLKLSYLESSQKSSEMKASKRFNSLVNMSDKHFSKNLGKKSEYSLVMTKEEDDIFAKDKMYSFITIDYTPVTFYWDSFFFGTNLILISISVASNNFPQLLYVGLILGIFFIMLLVSFRLEPFKYEEINNLMNLSFITIIITFFCVANITFLRDNYLLLENIYFAIIFISNGLFFLYWIYLFFLTTIISKITDIIQKIKDKKLKMTESTKKAVGVKKGKLEIEEKDDNEVKTKVKNIDGGTNIIDNPVVTEIMSPLSIVENNKATQNQMREIDTLMSSLTTSGKKKNNEKCLNNFEKIEGTTEENQNAKLFELQGDKGSITEE